MASSVLHKLLPPNICRPGTRAETLKQTERFRPEGLCTPRRGDARCAWLSIYVLHWTGAAHLGGAARGEKAATSRIDASNSASRDSRSSISRHPDTDTSVVAACPPPASPRPAAPQAGLHPCDGSGGLSSAARRTSWLAAGSRWTGVAPSEAAGRGAAGVCLSQAACPPSAGGPRGVCSSAAAGGSVCPLEAVGLDNASLETATMKVSRCDDVRNSPAMTSGNGLPARTTGRPGGEGGGALKASDFIVGNAY
jgi:hypothetical protein